MGIEDDKKLITLKEAAQISGYSSDYIGQLIRAGKIPGKQVYLNIAWMTTADAVLSYKNDKQSSAVKRTVDQRLIFRFRQFGIQLNIVKLFFQTFKTAIPILAVLILSFIALGILLIQVLFPNNSASLPSEKTQTDNFSF